ARRVAEAAAFDARARLEGVPKAAPETTAFLAALRAAQTGDRRAPAADGADADADAAGQDRRPAAGALPGPRDGAVRARRPARGAAARRAAGRAAGGAAAGAAAWRSLAARRPEPQPVSRCRPLRPFRRAGPVPRARNPLPPRLRAPGGGRPRRGS